MTRRSKQSLVRLIHLLVTLSLLLSPLSATPRARAAGSSTRDARSPGLLQEPVLTTTVEAIGDESETPLPSPQSPEPTAGDEPMGTETAPASPIPAATETATAEPTAAETITAEPTATETVKLEPTATASPTLTPTLAISATPTLSVSLSSHVITPQDGGEIRSADGRVRLIVPAGAVTETVRIEHRTRWAKRLEGGTEGIALAFELNAVTHDLAARPVHRFQKPLELHVDLSGLVELVGMPYYQNPYLAYQDEQGKWISLGGHLEEGILVGKLDHFSIIGAGVTNELQSGWLLSFNDANVAPFSGALTYDYPIEVPAGRGGLTPDLRLSYNSRRVDGILSWTQSDWAGLGWSVDTMEIVRAIKPTADWFWGWIDSNDMAGRYNQFTLMYNGTGYRLTPAEKDPPYGRYYTEDEQFLYIERRNDWGGNGSPDTENLTSEYWIVKLRDGTEYRLGYHEDSEQVFKSNYYWTDAARYAGDEPNWIAFRWRVDLIRDPRGNEIHFKYYDDEPKVCGPDRERASYLETIEYNFWGGQAYSRVRFLRQNREQGPSLWDGGHYHNVDCTQEVCCDFFFQDQYLDRIVVESRNPASGQWETVREYDLDYVLWTQDRPGDTGTRVLREIKHYGRGGVAGGQMLPKTSFWYWNRANKGAASPNDPSEWNRERFYYPRVSWIGNGYGGAILVEYETPDEFCCGEPYNYRVKDRVIEDGRGGGHRLVYTYASRKADRCYAPRYQPDVGFYFPENEATYGSLVGYRAVTETLQTWGGSPVAVTAYEFLLNPGGQSLVGAGRELSRTRKDPASGAELEKVKTTWVSQLLGSGSRFVYPQVIEEFHRVGAGLPGTPQKKVVNTYDTTYGNLTRMVEYDGDTAYRRTDYLHFPNTSAWIVDRPAQVTVLDGTGTTTQAITRYLYDENTSYWAIPMRGDVHVIKKATTFSPISVTAVQTTTFAGPSEYYMPVTVADGNGNVTQTTYDSSWRFPVIVTNAKDQETTYTYDYVLGKVLSETGPNAGSTTSYKYDSWGRLEKIIRPGDSDMMPTVKYEYCDTCSPLRITTSTIFQKGDGSLTYTPVLRWYDGLGRLIQENQATSSYTPGNAGQMRVTNYTYNAQGLQENVYTPYTYTATGPAVYIAPDPARPRTHYDYDALGRVTAQTNPDQSWTRTYYDNRADGFLRAVIDEENHQKIYKSDPFGRLVEVQEFTGTYSGGVNWGASAYATTRYAYNRLDLLTDVWDAANNHTEIHYDTWGRKTSMTDPDMGTWTYQYDNAGNLVRQTDALSQTICSCYDSLNRLTGKDYVDGASCPPTLTPDVVYRYDEGPLGVGYRTSMSDPSGHTEWAYDARGRMVRESKTINGASSPFITEWSYTPRDEVRTQTYPDGEIVTTAYGMWGQPATLTGADPYVVRALPDDAGRIDYIKLGGTDANPTLLLDYSYYAWDAYAGRGRLSRIQTTKPALPAATVQDLRYAYDRVGNVTRVEDAVAPAETVHYTYDELDRLKTTSGAYSRSYSYHPNGNLFDRTSNVYTWYGYDARHPHAVNNIKGTGGTAGKTLTVRAKATCPGSETVTLAVRINGTEYVTQTRQLTDSATYQDYDFTVTLRGNDLINIVAKDASSTRRLSVESVTVDGVLFPMAGTSIFDAGVDNAAFDGLDVSQGGTGEITTPGALRFVHGPAAYAASYDANGNMTSRCVEGKAYLLTWDRENRLTEIRQGNNVSTFVYDGDGRRVKATVDGETTYYVGDYYELKDDVPTSYYYHWGKRIAMRDSSGVHYLLSDQLGSTNASYRADGGATAMQRYYPWGNARAIAGTMPTDYAFTGQKADGSGLLFYNARWYDPAAARWTQPDTIVPEPGNPQDLNRYSYCRNNPLRYTDPTGRFTNDEIEAYLQTTYRDKWKLYLDAFMSDDVFWEMLLAAQIGDRLNSPFVGDAMFQAAAQGVFELMGGASLEEYQGHGPYSLVYRNENNEDRYREGRYLVAKPLPKRYWHGAGNVFDERLYKRQWVQPLFNYSDRARGPVATGMRHYASYGWSGGVGFNASAGSSMPYIVELMGQFLSSSPHPYAKAGALAVKAAGYVMIVDQLVLFEAQLYEYEGPPRPVPIPAPCPPSR